MTSEWEIAMLSEYLVYFCPFAEEDNDHRVSHHSGDCALCNTRRRVCMRGASE